MPPTTQKQIREVAYKKLEELQERLDKLADERATKAEIKALSALLLEARAQLQLTV